MSAATQTTIPPCCVVCHLVPEDPAALRDYGNPEPWSSYGNYWLCVDKNACTDRVNAEHRKAVEAEAPAAAEAPGGEDGTGEKDPPVSEAVAAQVREALAAAERGETAGLGDFTQYADPDPVKDEAPGDGPAEADAEAGQ